MIGHIPIYRPVTVVQSVITSRNTSSNGTDKNFKHYSWFDRGSDERQYCAPGVDLPIASILRSKFRDYPEYHTSLDDLVNVVTPTGLFGGYKALERAVMVIEKNKVYKVLILCEPHMSSRGIFPTLSTKKSSVSTKKMMNFLSVCDGDNTLLEIAELLDEPIWELYEIVGTLLKHNLIHCIGSFDRISAS
jgi:aminopeptidase-like protein